MNERMEKVNRMIARREELFARLDAIADDAGLDEDALRPLDMQSPEMLAKLAAAIKDVGHATQALEWAQEDLPAD